MSDQRQYDIFLSYSRKDKDFAIKLKKSLSDLGANIWLDSDDIPAGAKWHQVVQNALHHSTILVLIISPDSMKSANVEDEWQYFREENKPIIPVLWRDAEKHFQLRDIQHVDFANQDYAPALKRLCIELKERGIDLKGIQPRRKTAPLPNDRDNREHQLSYSGRETKKTTESPDERPSIITQILSFLRKKRVRGVVIIFLILIIIVVALSLRQSPKAISTPTNTLALTNTPSITLTSTTNPTYVRLTFQALLTQQALPTTPAPTKTLTPTSGPSATSTPVPTTVNSLTDTPDYDATLKARLTQTAIAKTTAASASTLTPSN